MSLFMTKAAGWPYLGVDRTLVLVTQVSDSVSNRGCRHKFQSIPGIRQVKDKALNKARISRPFSTAGITSNEQKPTPE